MPFEYNNIPSGSSQATDGNTNQTNQASGQPTQPTSTPKDITNNNIDISNPFAEPKTKNNVAEQPRQPAQATNQQGQPLTFADIVNQKQFGSLSKDLFDKVQDGDVDSFNSGLETMMRSVYKTAIEDSNRLMTARMEDFEQKLMAKLNSSKEADGLVNDLKTAIPYAQDAAVEPVARQVLSGYLRQGMSKNEAIAATNAYFGRLADKVGQSKEAKSDKHSANTLAGKAALDELFN